MKKIFLGIITPFLLIYLQSSFAICPICTVAVGAGIGLAEWFGVDDVISGIWIGGFTISLIIWTTRWLRGKGFNPMWVFPASFIVYYGLTLFSLRNFIGHDLNKLWGFDKLLLGITVGSIVFFASVFLYGYMKKKNNGHAYFPLQKVVMSVAPLIILSVIFYFVVN